MKKCSYLIALFLLVVFWLVTIDFAFKLYYIWNIKWADCIKEISKSCLKHDSYINSFVKFFKNIINIQLHIFVKAYYNLNDYNEVYLIIELDVVYNFGEYKRIESRIIKSANWHFISGSTYSTLNIQLLFSWIFYFSYER